MYVCYWQTGSLHLPRFRLKVVHLLFARWTRSRPIVIFNPGSCDCLHLYSEIHTDMLYNVECNIEVRHNPSICMNMYVVRIYLCCLISAEQKNEVHRHRAGASLQNIQPQMLHLSRKTSSKQNVLLRNESNSVSVSHLCCPRGINNLFGCGERSVKLKTAQMIHVSTRFFTWSLCQQTLEQRLQIRQSAESFWNWSNFRWCVY